MGCCNPPGGLNKFLIPMTQGRRVLATQNQEQSITFVRKALYHPTPNEAYFLFRVSFIPSPLHFGARNRLSSFIRKTVRGSAYIPVPSRIITFDVRLK